MEHISTEAIGKFLSCRLSREETRQVVRHLLSRCPTCLPFAQSVARLHPASSQGREFSPRRSDFGPTASFSALDKFLRDLALAIDPHENVLRFPPRILE